MPRLVRWCVKRGASVESPSKHEETGSWPQNPSSKRSAVVVARRCHERRTDRARAHRHPGQHHRGSGSRVAQAHRVGLRLRQEGQRRGSDAAADLDRACPEGDSMIVEMYGPRAKLLVNETGREFVLILDEFDVATGKSKVGK